MTEDEANKLNQIPRSPVAGPSHEPREPQPTPIDPALTASVPHQNLQEIAQSRGHSPARKVAGSRRPSKPDPKGKGKARATEVDSAPTRKRKRQEIEDSDDDEGARAPKKARGRGAGVANYREDEVDELLEIIEDELPVGGKGWQVVGKRHRSWSKVMGRPERTDKSLENKYKQV